MTAMDIEFREMRMSRPDMVKFLVFIRQPECVSTYAMFHPKITLAAGAKETCLRMRLRITLPRLEYMWVFKCLPEVVTDHVGIVKVRLVDTNVHARHNWDVNEVTFFILIRDMFAWLGEITIALIEGNDRLVLVHFTWSTPNPKDTIVLCKFIGEIQILLGFPIWDHP